MPISKIQQNSIADSAVHGQRNLIINGAMQVAQRGTSRSFGQTYNSLDRWATGQYQQAGHEQVSVTDTSVPTKDAVRVTSSSTSEVASGTRMALAQIVESQNCDFLAGKKVTLSFYIRFSDATMTGGGDFRFELSEYDSVDPNLETTGATRSNITNIAQGSLPTSWTRYTKTITCASTMKNLGARFLFNSLFNTTANSDEWYEVTAVQLEAGEATPFEHRGYADELRRCQRYFARIDGSVATSMGLGTAIGLDNDTSIIDIFAPVRPMRAGMTVTKSANADITVNTAQIAANATSVSFSNQSNHSVRVTIDHAAASGSTGGGRLIRFNKAAAYIHFDAEL